MIVNAHLWIEGKAFSVYTNGMNSMFCAMSHIFTDLDMKAYQSLS